MLLRDLSTWIMTFNLGLGRSLQVSWREQTELDSQLAQNGKGECSYRPERLTQPGSNGAGHRASALCSFWRRGQWGFIMEERGNDKSGNRRVYGLSKHRNWLVNNWDGKAAGARFSGWMWAYFQICWVCEDQEIFERSQVSRAHGILGFRRDAQVGNLHHSGAISLCWDCWNHKRKWIGVRRWSCPERESRRNSRDVQERATSIVEGWRWFGGILEANWRKHARRREESCVKFCCN